MIRLTFEYLLLKRLLNFHSYDAILNKRHRYQVKFRNNAKLTTRIFMDKFFSQHLKLQPEASIRVPNSSSKVKSKFLYSLSNHKTFYGCGMATDHVWANYFCASLLRTQIHTPRYAA